MDLDKALKLLHDCPNIGFCYNCNTKPIYTIEQKDLPILFEYIQKQTQNMNKDCTNCAGCTQWKCDCSNIRNQAIDDFAEAVKSLIVDLSVIRFKDIDEIAEQLKN